MCLCRETVIHGSYILLLASLWSLGMGFADEIYRKGLDYLWFIKELGPLCLFELGEEMWHLSYTHTL